MELEIAVNGTYVKLKGRGLAGGGGQRGDVRGFSRQSRARMMELFNKLDVDWRAHPLFITLTYPKEYSGNWKDWKRDLDVFLKRVERKLKKCACVWRLEFQKRGAPHFHILVFNASYLDKDWVARAWYAIVNSGDVKHLKAGTQCVRAKSDRQTCAYIAKYVAKVDSVGDDRQSGRIWGVRGRANLKQKIVKYCIPEQMFYKVRRMLRDWLERKIGRRMVHLRCQGRGGVFFISDLWVARVIQCVIDDLGTIWEKLFFPKDWRKVIKDT